MGEFNRFTEHSRKVLELSLREALSLGHNYIGTEHLLLGIVRDGECAAARVLAARGITASDIRQEVLRQIGSVKKFSEAEDALVERVAARVIELLEEGKAA